MLPINEPKLVNITPKNYLIWGESMSGKTYLATQFPNPILLNTDGNAVKVATPSVDIRDFETFSKIIGELEKGGHTYESIIIDLVDDLRTMLTAYVCKKYKVQTLSDVRFGKASGEFKDLWLRLMIKLSQMPQNIIFISHIIEANGFDENDVDKPSLQQRELNVCMGRCDIAIRCRKIRDNHIQQCDRKRHIYTLSDIQDERILKALANVKNLIER
jgi:hypothetical protein